MSSAGARWGEAGCVITAVVLLAPWDTDSDFVRLFASCWTCTCFQGSSCLTTFHMFLTAKCVAKDMKKTTRETEGMGRTDMSKSLWYKSVLF